MSARTPEDVDRLFGERLNAGDVDGTVALYEPSATLMGQDGTAATGPSAIREQLAGVAAMGLHLDMKVVRVVRGGDEVAVLYNDWTGTGTAPDGSRMEMTGKAIEVVRRQPDGTWRFIVDDPFARG